MKKAFILTALTITYLLSGCTTTQTKGVDLKNTQQISESITVQHDGFRNVTTVTAPAIREGNVFHSKMWFLRSIRVGQSERNIIQLYAQVKTTAKEHPNLSSAASQGRIFETQKIKTDVLSCGGVAGTCRYQEDVVAELTIKDLYELLGSNSFVQIGIADRYGDNWVFELTKEYIDAFASKIN